MKKYHELAHFQNEKGVITGFYLLNTENNNMYLIDNATMVEYCKKDLVQYFGYDVVKNTYIIRYSAEEMQQLGKLAQLPNVDNLDGYMENDLTISNEYFDICKNNPDVILGIPTLPMRLPLVGTMLPVTLLGNSEAIVSFTEQVSSFALVSRPAPFSNPCITLSYKVLQKLNETGNMCFPTNVVFDTYTSSKLLMTSSTNSIKKTLGIKQPLLKDASYAETTAILDILKQVTKVNLNYLTKTNQPIAGETNIPTFCNESNAGTVSDSIESRVNRMLAEAGRADLNYDKVCQFFPTTIVDDEGLQVCIKTVLKMM